MNDLYEADEKANQPVTGQERVWVTHGSNAVIGKDSHFTNLSGIQVAFDGHPDVLYRIQSVVNDKLLTLTTPYRGPTSSTATMLDLRARGRPTVSITPRGRAIAQALIRQEFRKKWGCLGPFAAIALGFVQMFQAVRGAGGGVDVAPTKRCRACRAVYFVESGHEDCPAKAG